MIAGYEKLDLWKLSHELAPHLFKLSKEFPRDERFGITAQLRRAPLAIPTNIAEGSARKHRQEFLQFCNISRGSLAETQYLLRFIRDLGWIDPQRYVEFRIAYERVGRMLNSMMTYLKGSGPKKKASRNA